jgi:hypothetical protein
MTYHPPLTITPAILNLVAHISEQVGRLSVLSDNADLRLCRIAPMREVQEVKNALSAYEQFEQWQADNEAGYYRSGCVGMTSDAIDFTWLASCFLSLVWWTFF